MFSLTHLHPMIVHFPIALVTIGFLADLLSVLMKKDTFLPKLSLSLLIVGTLSAIAAVLTGVFFTFELLGEAGTVRDTHALFAFVTLALLIVTCILKSLPYINGIVTNRTKTIAFLFYLLAMISVSITGYLGGSLVYNYMMPL